MCIWMAYILPIYWFYDNNYGFYNIIFFLEPKFSIIFFAWHNIFQVQNVFCVHFLLKIIFFVGIFWKCLKYESNF